MAESLPNVVVVVNFKGEYMIEKIKEIDKKIKFIDDLYTGNHINPHTKATYKKSPCYSEIKLAFHCCGYQGMACTTSDEVNREILSMLLKEEGEEFLEKAVETAKNKLIAERNKLSDELSELINHL